MANGLYRGYPPITQGVEAGRELLNLIRGGAFTSDIKHSVAICDTIGGAIAGVYPGAPNGIQIQPAALSLEQRKVFTDLKSEIEIFAAKVSNKTAVEKAVDEGAAELGLADLSKWLPFLLQLLELLRQYLGGATA